MSRTVSHGLTGPVTITGVDIYKQDATQQHPLGAIGVAENGDLYRYTWLAADVVAGKLLVSLAREDNHQNIALSAAVAVDDTLVKPTVGATAVDANEYDEGWLIFNDVSPEGEAYKIARHDASTGSEAVNIYLARKLLTAGTTSSEVTLVRNPWNRPVISQLITERACGVTMSDWDVSAAAYGWLKTRGMASVLVDTAGITVGYKATISDQVNGAVGLYSDVDAEFEVGQMMDAGTATEYNPIYLTID